MIPPEPPNGRVRVLVVEDSAFMREVIRQVLVSDPLIEVVGLVSDGVKAVEAVAALGPNVVAIDVLGPYGDGLAAVARVMTEHPTPVLVISSETREGSVAAIQALELGAVDFVTRPTAGGEGTLDTVRDAVLRKVKMAARVRPMHAMVVPWRPAALPGLVPGRAPEPTERRTRWTPCAVIAASTGGPAALSALVPALPAALPASVLLVTHLPASYSTQLARAIGGRSALLVKEAEEGERLTRGVVYVAPGSCNLTVSPDGLVRLRPAPRNAGPCPSANLAMTSVARHLGSLTVGVVLTGMGRDGAEGAAAIRRAGGAVIAQDEASSLVFGMPRAAIETGCVDAVVPLSRVAETLTARVMAMTPLVEVGHGV